MIKLVESLIAGAKGRGSRRVQVTGLALIGCLTKPDLAWHFVALATVLVAGLTATDVLGKAPEED